MFHYALTVDFPAPVGPRTLLKGHSGECDEKSDLQNYDFLLAGSRHGKMRCFQLHPSLLGPPHVITNNASWFPQVDRYHYLAIAMRFMDRR
jgi:hypothetical protein